MEPLYTPLSKSRRTLLVLTDTERVTLEAARDHHSKAYVRERAAALFFVAAGSSPHALDRQHLYKRRKSDTV